MKRKKNVKMVVQACNKWGRDGALGFKSYIKTVSQLDNKTQFLTKCPTNGFLINRQLVILTVGLDFMGPK